MPAPTQANSTSQWAKVSVGSSARRRVESKSPTRPCRLTFAPPQLRGDSALVPPTPGATRPFGLGRNHDGWVRDGLGVLLVAIGLTWAVLTRDKLGLVVAFAGVTLLAYGVLRPDRPSADGGKEPPIF